MARTPKVALLVETSRGYGRDLLRGVIRYARLHGPWGFYVTPGDFVQALPRMRSWGGTGIIARIETPAVARAILAADLPTIALDLSEEQLRPDNPLSRLSEVASDSRGAALLAAEHLLERGHERIAFIGGSSGLPQVQERHAGVERAVRRRFGSAEPLTVFSPETLTVLGGRESGAQIVGMSESRRPTAAVCANDLIALGLLQEMVRHGVRVPDDFAIVGYDDIDFAGAAAVPLTSVRKPRQELGRRAAELLIEEANARGTHLHQQLVFEPTLVVRESSMVRRVTAARRGSA